MIHFLPQTASSLPLSLLLLISISGFIIPSRCQLSYYCPESSNDTAYSYLNSDVNFLLGSLSSKASSYTFYNETSNGIYGLFLCRGDVSSEDCGRCVTNARELIKVNCTSRTNAIIWFEKCMLRYSFRNFFGIVEKVPIVQMWNTQNKTSPDDIAPLRQLISDASSADLMFKVDVWGSGNPTYGLAQCTRDVFKSECDYCLTNLADYARNCCLRQKGWRILAPNCNLRYESYLFFEIPGAPPSSLPAPPPDEEGDDVLFIFKLMRVVF